MKNSKKIVGITVRHLILVLLVAVWLLPILWLVVTSFSAYDGRNTSTFFPSEWSVHQYTNLLFHADTVANFPAWFKNTFLIATANCVISSIFVLMVAYAFSCMRFKGRSIPSNILLIIPGAKTQDTGLPEPTTFSPGLSPDVSS